MPAARAAAEIEPVLATDEPALFTADWDTGPVNVVDAIDAVSAMLVTATVALAPVALAGIVPCVVVVAETSPVKSPQELIAYAKANPDKLNYASQGIGTAAHLIGELFKAMAGIQINHVPYRGGGPAVNDLVAGHVPSLIASAIVGTLTCRTSLPSAGDTKRPTLPLSIATSKIKAFPSGDHANSPESHPAPLNESSGNNGRGSDPSAPTRCTRYFPESVPSSTNAMVDPSGDHLADSGSTQTFCDSLGVPLPVILVTSRDSMSIFRSCRHLRAPSSYSV